MLNGQPTTNPAREYFEAYPVNKVEIRDNIFHVYQNKLKTAEERIGSTREAENLQPSQLKKYCKTKYSALNLF